MRTLYRHKFVLLFVICCTVYSTESRYKENRRKLEKLSGSAGLHSSSSSGSSSSSLESTLPTTQHSLCSRHREMKLLCYCTPDESSYLPVSKAECWIFQTGLLQNDTTWSLFYQQKKLRQLKFVVQNSGHLDYIPTKYLEPLANLTAVTIEYAQIPAVKAYALASLPNLRVITLTNNEIEVLEQDAFANHVYLSELHLQHNRINELDRMAFRNLPVLTKLFLQRNNISTLHEEVFSELGKLEVLNLEHNALAVLTSDMFKGLGNLKHLKLTYNNLNFIGDTVFAELWSLQELELDDNHIERISERALDGLNNLKTLNLRNNVLQKLDNGLLRGTPALLSINLQDNLLETVTSYTFQPIMDNLVNNTSELLLSENKFICDCRLQWIFDLRNRTRNLQLKELLEEVLCTLYMNVKTTAASNFVKPLLDNESRAKAGAAGSSRRRNQWKASQNQKSFMDQKSTGIINNGNGNGDDNDADDDDANDDDNDDTNETKRTGTSDRKHSYNKNLSIGDNNMRTRSAIAHKPSGRQHAGEEYYGHDDAAFLARSQEFGTDDADDDVFGLMKKPSAYYQRQGGGAVSAAPPLSTATRGGAIEVKLLSLRPSDLPCSGELNDPTELPLSRESIGMDVRSPPGSSGANRVRLHPREGGRLRGILSVSAAMVVFVTTLRKYQRLQF